ncbi:YdcF family protein [Aminobacter sp. AP02]|uniref:YdcF family protein n=1 Tax=Aminobacter sp. AP02 TaxID=2135737 RepID=UPI001FE1FE21|nr:YdcF family protein [Aminobacter sp. AP02]
MFILVAAAFIFTGGFALFATHVSGLSTPADPARADAIIVLTGGQARLDAALDLLKAGKGERLLISGVHPAATRRQLQLATRSDKSLFSRVDIDRAALDTIGNAEESAKWVESHAYQRVILVTNNYHMPRSLLEMGRLLRHANLEPYPVVNSKLDDGSWLTKPEALRVLFTEYNKYLLALARGIVPVKPSSDGELVAQAQADE